MMKIAIGNDHVAVEMKKHIVKYLEEKGYEIVNFGTDSAERADYPVYGKRVADAVASGECVLGILICGTGIGISLAANKVKGIRAAVCSEPYSAALTRRHNNANIIAFGARVVGTAVAETIVDAFLEAEFEGGRHARRVDMITAIESGEVAEC
ncbi:MAG: ribose 5-phosphate isomerase B [Clostridia bacterium]|nr:ribose 5-phosphate isomerase B [Clostridia bacterium]